MTGFHDGYAGLVQRNSVELTNESISGILNVGGTILGTSNKADPFRWVVQQPDGELVFSERSKEVMDYCEELGLAALGCR